MAMEPAMYRVEVDWAPAYELLVSLKAYLSRPEQKILDLGAGWARGVRQQRQAQLGQPLIKRRATPVRRINKLDRRQPLHEPRAVGCRPLQARQSVGTIGIDARRKTNIRAVVVIDDRPRVIS